MQEVDLGIARNDLVGKLRDHMIRLGLDKAGKGIQPALTHLDAAKTHVETPISDSGSGAAVLLQIRSCVDMTFAELIRRIPGTQRQKNAPAKIQFLADKASFPHLHQSYFDALKTQIVTLNDDLSDGKDKITSRGQALVLFTTTVTFLTALLSAVDDKRLSPPPV